MFTILQYLEMKSTVCIWKTATGGFGETFPNREIWTIAVFFLREIVLVNTGKKVV